MTAGQIFVSGIAPEHVPALLAPLVLFVLRRFLRLPSVALPDRVVGWLMAVSAAVHVALPFGHQDGPLWTLAFLGSGAAYGWLAYRALTGRRYRVLSVLLILATLVAYLAAILSGAEDADQVGLATALVELVALGLCLVTAEPRRVRRVLGSVAYVVVVILVGALAWVGALARHAAGGAGAVGTVGSAHHHDHSAGARAQAGVLVAAGDGAVATPDQVRAADALVAQTRAGLARFSDIHAALADGYRTTISRAGYDVHLSNDAYGKDGRLLDPRRPEELMYAIADGKATLLSAVYVMPTAGTPAPTPGGPLTHWHSHNVCLSAVPPGFSVVDAFGGCPPFAVKVALPLMMHVWVVDDPGGPFADGVPDTWTRVFNLDHGVPFAW
jgi:hypothetical protein